MDARLWHQQATTPPRPLPTPIPVERFDAMTEAAQAAGFTDIYDKKLLTLTAMEKLMGKKIDIAFFPVDPRLEQAYYYGGKYFIEKIKPKYFIPMHFQDSYTITTKFKKLIESEGLDTKVFNLNKRGEIIEL